jgi:hypothetical protein
MKWILISAAVVIFITVWIFVFRAALKKPNNGNEFSRDEPPAGSGG